MGTQNSANVCVHMNGMQNRLFSTNETLLSPLRSNREDNLLFLVTNLDHYNGRLLNVL